MRLLVHLAVARQLVRIRRLARRFCNASIREFLIVVLEVQLLAVLYPDGEWLLRHSIVLLNALFDVLQLLLDVQTVDAVRLRFCRAAARSVLLLLTHATHSLLI